MSNNLEHGSSSSKRPSSLFLSLSSYNRFHSQHPNPTASRNNPEHGDGDGDGDNSSKPSSSLFFTLSSYNRFRASRSRRIPSSSSSSSDSIRYSLRDISSAVENSHLPTSDPIPYSLTEISSAVENSTTSVPLGRCSIKRCTLRNEKVLIFCVDHIRFQSPDLFPSHLSTLTSRSHHPSLVKLLGASQSHDRRHVYMVYEDISGTTLKKCLQTSNSNLLSNWIRMMQVALDLAQGLEYIHHHCGMVHNMITSSTVIVTKPNSNACICLFGADDFSNRGIEGLTGYAAPELIKDGNISQKSDVYAFGVVILELISGNAAWECEEDRHKDVLTVEKARHAICRGEGEREDDEIRRGRVMQFVDWKLHGSFPMETAESLIKLALKCVEHVPGLRPEMASVAEDIRRLFLDSKACLEVPPAEEDYEVSDHLRPEMASVAEEEYEVSGEDSVDSERFLSPR